MPPRSVLRAFLSLWVISGLALFYASAMTVRDAWFGGHANFHLAALGSLETLAALLFVLPSTLRLGAAGLLGTFAVAFAVHLAAGQVRADLLLYAAAVTFVAVHGPLTRVQLRAAMSRPAV